MKGRKFIISFSCDSEDSGEYFGFFSIDGNFVHIKDCEDTSLSWICFYEEFFIIANKLKNLYNFVEGLDTFAFYVEEESKEYSYEEFYSLLNKELLLKLE